MLSSNICIINNKDVKMISILGLGEFLHLFLLIDVDQYLRVLDFQQ